MADMWIVIGAISGFIAVAAGAFGDHGLRGRISDDMLRIWNVAAHYQLTHSILIAAIALVGDGPPPRLRIACLSAFTIGILIFSGSLYALALTETKALGAITPVGGVALLTGWVLLAVIGFKRRCGKSISIPPMSSPIDQVAD